MAHEQATVAARSATTNANPLFISFASPIRDNHSLSKNYERFAIGERGPRRTIGFGMKVVRSGAEVVLSLVLWNLSVEVSHEVIQQWR
jgi:hypothetical protein